jgi:competence protein ComEC
VNEIRRPLVAALLSYLTGLTLSLRFAPPLLPALLLAIATLLLLGRHGKSPGARTPRTVSLLLLALFVVAGALVGTLARRDVDSDCRASLPEGEQVSARGLLGAESRPASEGGSRPPSLPLLRPVLEGVAKCGGEIRVRLPDGGDPLEIGTHVTLHGRWRTATFATADGPWPRDPRFRGFLAVDSVVVERPRSGTVAPLLGLRAIADRSLQALFPRHAVLVEALLLGRREYLDAETRERFSRAGLSHLLAISGMHVGLLAGALLLVGSAIRLSRKRAVVASLAVIWVYLGVIGASSSALRAGTMITLGLGALLLQRPSAPSTIVAAAAFAITALRPLAILDPGFQLSFAGVLGLLFLRRPILALAPDALVARGWRRALADGLAVGAAAFVTTAPIVAHHFGIVAPISIVAGIPAVPLMTLGVVGALAALVLAPVLPPLATLFADGAGLALDLLDRLATLAASVPFGNAEVGKPPWWSWTAAALVGIGTSSLVPFMSARVRRVLAVGSAALALLVWPLAPRLGPEGLEIHFLDVGQGDAVAIRTPGGRWVLVDAGPADARFDAGERRVVPFLRGEGARRVEVMVLTHPHLDHIGGARAVLDAFPVGQVVDPGHAVGSEPYLDLLARIEGSNARWVEARSGRSFVLDEVRFDMLWPDPETLDATEDANQISVVLRVSYGGFALVLPGDAGAGVEHLLVDRHGPDLRAEVLKLGHHGSSTSSSDAWLDAISPRLAVVSAGRNNRFGHPARDVMERVTRRGIAVGRTDQEGTVSVIVAPGGERWSRRER